jgi:hypothetical protein
MNADNNTRPNATNKIESNLKRVLLAKVAKMIADILSYLARVKSP